MARRFKLAFGDVAFKATGFGLAALSATFAFDTATQPQRYGPPMMRFERLDQVAQSLGDLDREYAGLVQLRVSNDERELASNAAGIDRTVTGSISASSSTADDDTSLGIKPKVESLLLFAAKGRALVSVDGRMVIAAPGTRLADGDIVQHVGTDTVTTRGGRVFEKAASEN